MSSELNSILFFKTIITIYCCSIGASVLPKIEIAQVSDGLGLRYIGCYDSWEGSTGRYFGNFYNPDAVSVHSCLDTCRRLDVQNREDYVVLVKERYCVCVNWEEFVNTRVDDKYCSIECSDPETTSCGGNYGFSAYCNSSFENCITFEPTLVADLYKSSEPTRELSPDKQNMAQVELYLACAHCPTCYGTYYPRFDYLPRNTPDACIQFCSRRINYWANGVKVRDPTALAGVGWARGKVPGILTPSCACLDLSATLEEVDHEECDQACPGDQGQICGGSEKFRFTVYRTGILDPKLIRK